jgi:hypothetical protein
MEKVKQNYLLEHKLQVEFGSEAICGYARDHYRIDDNIECMCALDKTRCKRPLPMNGNECDKCIRYFLSY